MLKCCWMILLCLPLLSVSQPLVPDCCGLNDDDMVNTCEANFLSAYFEDVVRGEFDFEGKKIGFVSGQTGMIRKEKSTFFDYLRTGNTNCQLLLFSTDEVQKSGEFEAAIAFGVKIDLSAKHLQVISLLAGKDLTDQKPKLTVVSVKNPNKRYTVDLSYDLNLTYVPETSNAKQTETIDMTGIVLDGKDSTLQFQCSREIIQYNAEQLYNYRKEISYMDFSNGANERQLDINRISEISFTTNHRFFSNSVGTTLIILGMTATLLAAPVSSINYASWEFNSRRYFTIAGSGLVVFACGIPLTALGRNHTFHVVPKNQADALQNPWYLEISPATP